MSESISSWQSECYNSVLSMMATGQRVIAHTRGPPLDCQVNFPTFSVTVRGNDISIILESKVITLQNLLRHILWHPPSKGLLHYDTERQLNNSSFFFALPNSSDTAATLNGQMFDSATHPNHKSSKYQQTGFFCYNHWPELCCLYTRSLILVVLYFSTPAT